MVTVEFPVARYETCERAVDDTYRVRWLGDSVSGIDPGGSYLPLYRHGPEPGPARRVERPRYEGDARFR